MVVQTKKDAGKIISQGFTIVELLIVVVVIAILAAITIIAYNGIQNRANDSAVMTDLRQFGQKNQIYSVDSTFEGISSDALIAQVETFNWKASKSAYNTDNRNLALCLNHNTEVSRNTTWGTRTTTRTDWALVAQSKSGNIFYVSNKNLTPKLYDGATPLVFDSTELYCGTMIDYLGVDGFTGTYHGFMASDSTTGPWRDWAGGNDT
jgi:prepilin-type N-terminal cleavage/methylation domain-containing protein